jgi:hypothetical protein
MSQKSRYTVESSNAFDNSETYNSARGNYTHLPMISKMISNTFEKHEAVNLSPVIIVKQETILTMKVKFQFRRYKKSNNYAY